MPKIFKCCILGCRESSRNVIDELSFHRIPRDEATRSHWISIIRQNTNQSNVFPAQAIVCSRHFPKTSFIDRVNGSRFLQKNSIPSIFPNPKHESSKTVWSDNDDDDDDDHSNLHDANEMTTLSPLQSLEPAPMQSLEAAPPQPLLNDKKDTHKKLEHDDRPELIKTTVYNDHSKNCRFCLTLPKSIQISSLPAEDISKMYESLTGLEYTYNPHHAPDIICTTCSIKLKSAFEFQEYLIETNNRWEKMISEQRKYSIKMVQDHNLPELSLVQPKSEVVLIEVIDECHPESSILQPKLEVILIEDASDYHPIETAEEYLKIEYLKDDNESEHLNDEKESELESDEDEKFIKHVQEFIKTVQPIKSSEPVKRRTNKYPKTKVILPDKERLNFRSTSSPHSSQKLKKDKNWWRLMHDCSYCDAKDFLTVTDLNKHLKSEHPEQLKVTCDICKKDYSELIYLIKHMKYVHQTKHNKCDQCGKSFYYNYNLKSHMLLHTNEQKTVICHLCGKFFTSTALNSHLRSGAHGGQELKNRSYSKSQRYYCHICVPAQRFDLCSDLTEHRRLMHKDFNCSICKGWFSCMEALENHLKTHSNKERKFGCKLCSSTFVRASHLEGHIRRKHSATPKPIRCDLCDYRCVEPYELTGHKRHAHSKIRMFKCMHCEKSFTHAQAHKDHMLTSHNIGEYRYSCAYCPKRFTNSAALIHHRGVHHNGAGNQ